MSEKRERNISSKLHQSEGTTRTITTSPTSTIQTKDCDLQSSLKGATGAKNTVYRLGLSIYGQRSIPPQPEAIRGPGEASGTSHLSASVANFRLIRKMSSGVGGLA